MAQPSRCGGEVAHAVAATRGAQAVALQDEQAARAALAAQLQDLHEQAAAREAELDKWSMYPSGYWTREPLIGTFRHATHGLIRKTQPCTKTGSTSMARRNREEEMVED